MNNIILKTGVASFAIVTLLATGGTTDVDPTDNKLLYLSNYGNVENQTTSQKQVKIELIDNGFNKTIKHEGKTYNFTKDDIKTRADGLRYYEIETDDNNFITLENKSIVEYFEHEGKEAALLRTAYVTIWKMDIKDYDSQNNLKFQNNGYFITGDKPEAIPNDRVVTFNGRLEGDTFVKSTSDSYKLIGDVKIMADFNIGAQSLKGSFTDIQAFDIDDKFFGNFGDVAITKGTINNGSFAGELKFANENVQVLSSSMSGDFYGTDANFEIGGVGQIETDFTTTSFGFTGKK